MLLLNATYMYINKCKSLDLRKIRLLTKSSPEGNHNRDKPQCNIYFKTLWIGHKCLVRCDPGISIIIPVLSLHGPVSAGFWVLTAQCAVSWFSKAVALINSWAEHEVGQVGVAVLHVLVAVRPHLAISPVCHLLVSLPIAGSGTTNQLAYVLVNLPPGLHWVPLPHCFINTLWSTPLAEVSWFSWISKLIISLAPSVCCRGVVYFWLHTAWLRRTEVKSNESYQGKDETELDGHPEQFQNEVNGGEVGNSLYIIWWNRWNSQYTEYTLLLFYLSWRGQKHSYNNLYCQTHPQLQLFWHE